MNRLQRAAIVTELIERLREAGSWSGETHIQKATFFLQELAEVPTDYEFILYRYGPYSRELTQELVGMRADGLIDLEQQPYPYGPSLQSSESSEQLRERFSKTLHQYQDHVERVVDALGTKDASQLERLSTALFFRKRRHLEDVKSIAEAVVTVKPHVSIESAEAAAAEVIALEGAIA